jgi:hypothetical protein
VTTPANSLEDPFYYLSNFRQVLDWLRQRYSDVLSPDEQGFIDTFMAADHGAQALLVRMIMRKGPLYRASKLVYSEIGAIAPAAAVLLAHGWICDQQPLSLEALFEVLGKAELYQRFRRHGLSAGARKAVWLEQLAEHYPEPQPFSQWWPAPDEAVYCLKVRNLCERLRLLYFGNLHQDWSEFVLADLGIFEYERVPFSTASRSLHSASDIDQYMVLHGARQALEAGEERGAIVTQVLALELANVWLQGRRDKLLYQVAYACEREGERGEALALYQASAFANSRARQIRVLELLGRFEEAKALAELALAEPHNAAEHQQVLRMLPRLRRALGLPAEPKRKASPPVRMDLCLVRDGAPRSVEYWVQAHLHAPQAPVFYVENTLFNALFGLLCWPAIFAPLPGAFFNPFQSGPADLHQPDFLARRAELFDACLATLDDGSYRHLIRERHRSKYGLQSPFVYWQSLDDTLLELALACIPASHLRQCFRRMLEDLKANGTGMPDLIQFWPQEGRYRMIEVKGPGDRLQDNQLRWLAFCEAHGMPVEVCYVTWDAPACTPETTELAQAAG